MIEVSAADYAWTEAENVPQEYCLTLVRGLSAPEFLQRVGAEPGPTVTGMDALTDELWTAGETESLGVAGLEGRTLDSEVNGYLGVSEEISRPQSAGTRLVSHYWDLNADARLIWNENGDLHLSFDPASRTIEQAALKCVYMAVMSLDPTGTGQTRWTKRGKPALGAFDRAFDGRLTNPRH
ncbi:hypothetical protein GCM10010468_20960 [Actinocorallia longicatena]|uniref:Uncharacterized protein n=1 Tax=Actinocorallia longicatena TaxID=111803 RepID=A0ABP6Q6B6_9ACTN